MPRFLLSGLILVLLAGCQSVPSSQPPEPATSATLPAIVPADEFEAALLKSPVDADALARHATYLATRAGAEPDAGKARQLRRHAREFGALAIKSGSDNVLMPLLLAEIEPDGNAVTKVYAANPRVDALLRSGEVKFGAGKFAAALEDYQAAYALDPRNYQAALYAGDVFFGQKEFERALPWFDRAMAIDPTIETAHRYKADTLMRLHRTKEAGACYVDAFIAAPFAPIPTASLKNWAARQGFTLVRPDTSYLRGSLQKGHEGLTILYDPNQPGSQLCLIYMLARTAYANQHSAGQAGTYRDTLAEEISALRTLIIAVGELRQTDPNNAELKEFGPSLSFIEDMDQRGLLEAFVLLDRTNNDLLKDFASYRDQHADVLARYIKYVWLKNTLSGP